MKKELEYEQIFAMPQEQLKEIMSSVVEKCKNDNNFEHDLMSKPTEILKREGVKLQSGISFQVVKSEEEAKLLPDNVIPLFMADKKGALSPEQLDKVAGGVATGDGMADVAGGIFGRISSWMRGGEPRPQSSGPLE